MRICFSKPFATFQKKVVRGKLLIFLLLVTFLIPLTVEGIEIENPLGYDTFIELINKIIDFIFYISFFGIGPLMIIIAGFYFVTATGDPKKIDTAKKMILWTLIGLLVVISAKGLIALFREIFGIEEGTTVLPGHYIYVKNILKLG